MLTNSIGFGIVSTVVRICASGSAVEHLLAKEGVAGSIPVSRSEQEKRYPNGYLFSCFEPNSGLEVRSSPFHSGPRITRGPPDLMRPVIRTIRQSLKRWLSFFVKTMSQVDKHACMQLSIWRMYIIELISEMYPLGSPRGVLYFKGFLSFE